MPQKTGLMSIISCNHDKNACTQSSSAIGQIRATCCQRWVPAKQTPSKAPKINSCPCLHLQAKQIRVGGRQCHHRLAHDRAVQLCKPFALASPPLAMLCQAVGCSPSAPPNM